MQMLMTMKKQDGVALVISVVFLFVMTIVGVALVGGSVMQERMAGNQRLQTLAFEAASAGVAEALNWGFETNEAGQYVNWGEPSCSYRDVDGELEGDKWESQWSEPRSFGGAEYRLKIRCRADEPFADVAGFVAADEPVPPQLFVVSDGVVRGADDTVVARRQIEVRIENRAGTDGNLDSAIRIEGDSINFEPATSNRFLVDGNGGAAIATTDPDEAETIEAEIASAGSGRLGNYPGGIEEGVGQYPFDSPESIAEFAREVKLALQGGAACGNWVEDNIQGAGEGGGSGGSPTCDAEGAQNFADLGDFPFSGNNLTYVTGDAIIGPNLEGSGLLIVEGKVCMSGRADFKGQVIALGGLFEMYGAGNGRTEGAVFVADVDPDGMPSGWGETTLDVSGGGNHRIRYDCDRVEQALNLARACVPSLADSLPQRCDGEGGRFQGIGARIQMVGWRESLGWREDFFDDEVPEEN